MILHLLEVDCESPLLEGLTWPTVNAAIPCPEITQTIGKIGRIKRNSLCAEIECMLT